MNEIEEFNNIYNGGFDWLSKSDDIDLCDEYLYEGKDERGSMRRLIILCAGVAATSEEEE